MDQNSHDSLPSVELPAPQSVEQSPESTSTDIYTEQASAKQLEQAPQVASASDPAGMQPLVQSAQNSAVQNQPMGTQSPPLASVNPLIADDTDLIEKEWVDRAKRIVEHTRHDPHLQTREMNHMKADYLKKRYNKDLKLGE